MLNLPIYNGLKKLECQCTCKHQNIICCNSCNSTILGGCCNVINDGGRQSSIIGGYYNEAAFLTRNSSIIGGCCNILDNNVCESTILGGFNNCIYHSCRSSIIGGRGHDMYCS